MYAHNIVTSKVDLWEKCSLFLTYSVTGSRSCILLANLQKYVQFRCEGLWVHLYVTAEPCTRSRVGIRSKLLSAWDCAAITQKHCQKYCQLLKVRMQVRSSQQHTQASNSDLSAWQTGSNTGLTWHVCVASSSGVTSVSYFVLFCITVQGTDMASDLDRDAYMQNCDP